MKSSNQDSPPDSAQRFQKSKYANIVRYKASGTYYARFRIGGKLINRSLKTDLASVAQLRLADMQKEERKKLERGQLLTKGKVLFSDALRAYRDNGFRPAVPRNRKDARPLKPAAFDYYEQRAKALLKSWPDLESMEVRRITEKDCQVWATQARMKMSGSAFNHTLGLLRNTFGFAIKLGARYDDPARAVMRASEEPESPVLPSQEQFAALLTEIENGGGGTSRHCADLVRFLAFGGFRKTEAAFITWADCDFEKQQITVRGHPETGLKNRRAGDVRYVPMVTDMVPFLRKLQAENPSFNPADRVMVVRECQKSIDRAALELGIPRLKHHDLRHYFATRCIESNVDIPTVSGWLGHRDGGALLLRRYGHLRNQHSVRISSEPSSGSRVPTTMAMPPTTLRIRDQSVRVFIKSSSARTMVE